MWGQDTHQKRLVTISDANQPGPFNVIEFNHDLALWEVAPSNGDCILSIPESYDGFDKFLVPFEGQVTAVSNDLLEISIGFQEGVRRGILLDIYRNGKPVAQVKVVLVKLNISVCEIISKGDGHSVRQGDLVRNDLSREKAISPNANLRVTPSLGEDDYSKEIGLVGEAEKGSVSILLHPAGVSPSAGSGHGIRKGQVLTVNRAQNYVHMLRVLETTPGTLICETIPYYQRLKIRQGDSVSLSRGPWDITRYSDRTINNSQLSVTLKPEAQVLYLPASYTPNQSRGRLFVSAAFIDVVFIPVSPSRRRKISPPALFDNTVDAITRQNPSAEIRRIAR